MRVRWVSTTWLRDEAIVATVAAVMFIPTAIFFPFMWAWIAAFVLQPWAILIGAYRAKHPDNARDT